MNNNSTDKFIKNDITQKNSKYWDMQYYWLREQHIKNRFNFHWKKSSDNLADCHTKHILIIYHENVCSKYVTSPTYHLLHTVTFLNVGLYFLNWGQYLVRNNSIKSLRKKPENFSYSSCMSMEFGTTKHLLFNQPCCVS